MKRALTRDSYKTYHERLLYSGLVELKRFCFTLYIPSRPIPEEAFKYYKSFLKKKEGYQISPFGHLYACVLFACRSAGRSLTYEEILNNSNDPRIDETVLKRCVKLTAEVLEIKQFQTDYDNLINDISTQLGILPKITEEIVRLFNDFCEKYPTFVLMKNPRGICAAAMYVLTLRHSYNISQQIIADKFNIKVPTLRTNFREIRSYYDSISSVSKILQECDSGESKEEYLNAIKQLDSFIKFYETVKSYTEEQRLKEFKYPSIDEELKQLPPEKESIADASENSFQIAKVIEIVRNAIGPLSELSAMERKIFSKTNMFLDVLGSKANLNDRDIADFKEVIGDSLRCSSLPLENKQILENLIAQNFFLFETSKTSSPERAPQNVSTVNEISKPKRVVDLCAFDLVRNSNSPPTSCPPSKNVFSVNYSDYNTLFEKIYELLFEDYPVIYRNLRVITKEIQVSTTLNDVEKVSLIDDVLFLYFPNYSVLFDLDYSNRLEKLKTMYDKYSSSTYLPNIDKNNFLNNVLTIFYFFNFYSKSINITVLSEEEFLQWRKSYLILREDVMDVEIYEVILNLGL